MAKVAFTKLGLSKNQEVENIEWNEQNIEVKQYLPINEKLTLISNVMNNAHDENNFSNPVKIDVFTALEIMFAYTNINFTEKQKEDVTKLYDLLVSSGLYAAVIAAIPVTEYATITCGIRESIDAIYTYRNSALGILDSISTDYSNLNLDASEIQKKLSDPENMELLRNILTKLG
jgi:hypothetical protein